MARIQRINPLKSDGIRVLLLLNVYFFSVFAAAGCGDPAGAGAAAGALPNGTALTGVPGLAFCSPSRMTRSPAFNPSLTSQLSPTVLTTLIGRGSTFSSAPTVKTMASPFG